MLFLPTGPNPVVRRVFCEEMWQDRMEKVSADRRLPGIIKSVALSVEALAESCTTGISEPEARPEGQADSGQPLALEPDQGCTRMRSSRCTILQLGYRTEGKKSSSSPQTDISFESVKDKYRIINDKAFGQQQSVRTSTPEG